MTKVEHGIEVDLMRCVFLLLILVTQTITSASESSMFSSNELLTIQAEVCRRLNRPNGEPTETGSKGTAFFLNSATVKAQVEVSPFPSLSNWRMAIVTVFDTEQLPTVQMRLAKGCKPVRTRQIVRQPDQAVFSIVDLDHNFMPIGSAEVQNPRHHFSPKPADDNPKNPRIAIVDTGVNYTLSDFQSHIAIDADGRLIGYDFWEYDDWPYDSDPRRNIFFPLHHGSTVFSVLSREAGESTISIYRFPALKMCQFSALLEHIARTPVRLVNLSMGSDDYEDWKCFESAAKSLPDLLFIVSAGNNGRNIDLDPLYPASLALENMIVVSSANSFGRLGKDSNFGKKHVDLMVPAEEIEVIDHRGARAKTGGTSYAAPRVTALLGRYLQSNPTAKTQELINFLRDRAIPSAGDQVKFGWIPDPTDDFGF